MKIAVVGGTGKEGFGLALRWARAGNEVVIGSRTPEKAAEAAAKARELVPSAKVSGTSNTDAAGAGEVVVISVPFSAHRETVQGLKPFLAGKIVVDVCVPLKAGSPTEVEMPPEGSAAEQAQSLLGPEARVVGAFENVSAHGLSDLGNPVECDILICGDNREAKETVAGLAESLGARAFDAGCLSQARTVERITALLIGLNIRYKKKGIGLRLTGL